MVWSCYQLLPRTFFMKENYFDEAMSFKNLYKGLKSSCRNVRWKDSVIRYEAYGLRNTYILRQEVLNGTYEISPYQKFHIHEPKERLIYAPRLRDRQLQHALCDNGLYNDIAEHFIRDSMACQRGRGTDDALRRLKVHMQRYYRAHNTKGWYLKCDIHQFFPSTPHWVVEQTAHKYISDPKAADMVCRIANSFDGNIGLGLGSQISQIMELLVLNDLDHFIKEQLHIKQYIRYMDDFILIHPDKNYLKQCKKVIYDKLAAIGLLLNKKTELQPLQHGIIFLKWHYYMTETGKIIMLMRRQKITKFKHHLARLAQKNYSKLKSSLESFLANAKRGNTHKICRYMRKRSEIYERNFSKNKIGRSTKCSYCLVS